MKGSCDITEGRGVRTNGRGKRAGGRSADAGVVGDAQVQNADEGGAEGLLGGSRSSRKRDGGLE